MTEYGDGECGVGSEQGSRMNEEESLSADPQAGQELLVVCTCVTARGMGVSVSHMEMCSLCAHFQSYHSPPSEVAVFLRKMK